jgi:hypothetical protein
MKMKTVETVNVKQLASHELSVEQQLYYKEITEVINSLVPPLALFVSGQIRFHCVFASQVLAWILICCFFLTMCVPD